MKLTNLSKYTKQLSKHFSSSENILLVCHINPDGDAIGSMIALYDYISTLGKKVSMLSPNSLQEFLVWMKGSEHVNVFIKDRKRGRLLINEADLIIMVDFNHPERLGEAETYVTKSNARKIIIDHHLNSQGFADFMVSEPTYCSTAEIVYELVTGLNGGNYINQMFAEAIYVGIITDTGNFEYGTYTGNTLRIVAGLLDFGLDKDRIINLIYNTFSAERLRLQGFTLDQRMVILPEYNSAYIYLSKDDLEKYKYLKGDTDGFVNIPLAINGINFSTLLLEKDGFIKLSFRSKGLFDVNDFAEKYFSGGGHKNASGGEYKNSMVNTINYFVELVKENSEKLRY
jgi:bifunctional oligoribonuclease and PAP phosphatase NrnA